MPVNGVTAADIAVRASFFAKATELLLEGPAFSGCLVEVHLGIHSVIAEGFFALADAYERHHLKPGKKIEPVKQAALTCAVVCAISPLRPTAALVEEEELLYINPMLAMRAACSVIGHPFDKRAFDERRRHYRMVGSLRLPSLAPLIAEANANDGVLSSDFSFDLAMDERHRLNGLINYFTVLNDMK